MFQLKSWLIAALIAVIAASAAAADSNAMRCGSELVNLGDRAFQVRDWCGEPVSRQITGYTVNSFGERELIIEEWVYGPTAGYYYFITVQGGKVTEIDSEHY